MTTRLRAFSHPDDVAVVFKVVNRFVLAILGIGPGLVSVMLFRTIDGPAVAEQLRLYELFGVIGILGGAALVMRGRPRGAPRPVLSTR